MKRAKDLMSGDPKVCRIDESLEDLLQLFLSSGFKYIPIVDEKDNCIALMDELGIIKALSDKSTTPDQVKVEHYKKFFVPPCFVDASASIKEILPAMLSAQTHRVVVVSGSKKPLGILSPSNVLRAIVGLDPKSQNMNENLSKTTDFAETNWKGTVTTDIFKEAFDKSPYLMVMADTEGIIKDANDRIELLYGKPAESFVGVDLASLFPKFAAPKISKALNDAKNLGRCPTQPTALQHPSGRLLNMDMAISGIRDESKNLSYYCAVFRELTGDEIQSNI